MAFALLNLLPLISAQIDLTWDLNNNTQHWPGASPFEFTKQIVSDNIENWYAMNDFKMGEHTGTHIDAPYHFYKDGWKIADIPLERLIAQGILINVSSEVTTNDFELSRNHIEKWELKYGPIPNNSILLIDFGWSNNYHSKEKYFGLSTNNTSKLSFPGISAEAAEWIVQSNRIYGVGVDTPSVDSGKSITNNAHKILARKNIYNLENVALNTTLPAKGFTLIVMPLKITYGTGAPTRIVAVSKDNFN